MRILNEEEKEKALTRLSVIEKMIDDSLAIDIPVDHLIDEKYAVEDAIADYNATGDLGDRVDDDDEGGNQDAPFHRVFLLIEVDQENIADAYDYIYHNCPGCCGIRTFEEIQHIIREASL